MEESRLRTQLGQWRTAHPQATFEEIEDEVYRQVAVWYASLVGELAQAGAADGVGDGTEMGGEEPPRCAACGVGQRASGWRRRQVVTRMGATTTLERRYWVCPTCGAGLFPPR